jgi:hypothetical protein
MPAATTDNPTTATRAPLLRHQQPSFDDAATTPSRAAAQLWNSPTVPPSPGCLVQDSAAHAGCCP